MSPLTSYTLTYVIYTLFLAVPLHSQVLLTARNPPKVQHDEDYDFHNQNVTFIDDAKTTVEIFRQNRRTPENQKTVYHPVRIQAEPSIQIESSSQDIYSPQQDDYPALASSFDDGSGFTSDGRITEARPTRFYPVQQNSFIPMSDFGPATFPNENTNSQKLRDITQGKPSKKKFSSKYRKYPKKYASGVKKQKLNKPKINPLSEAVDDFSEDSFKNKRKIPFSADLTNNGFSSPQLESLITPDKGNYHSFPQRSASSEGFVGQPEGGFSAPLIGGGSGSERMQFQMFGMDGPHSYKFGYDTGEGHNRHFRYEERDNHGRVKGHYGFYDQEGKMSMIHYEADPHTGYKAGPYHHPENHLEFDYNHQNDNK